jgi:hypothetical protein
VTLIMLLAGFIALHPDLLVGLAAIFGVDAPVAQLVARGAAQAASR